MMRLRLRTRPTALFGALLAAAMIALLPMRLALGWVGVGDEGLSARAATGVIWAGSLKEARFGDLALGDLDAGLAPLPLLIGRARIDLNGRALHGAAIISRHVLGADDLTATIATGGVFAPLPVTSLGLDGVTMRFRDGRCESAAGRITATLGGDAAGIVLPPTVAGTIRCDGGALLVPLAGQAGCEGVTLRIEGDGRYHADLRVQPADAVAVQRLAGAGFVVDGAAYRLSIEGRF